MKLALVSLVLLFGILGGCTKETKEEPSPQKQTPAATTVSPPTSGTGAPSPSAPSAAQIDLQTDANGLSKATVVMKTSRGILKFRLYPKDAPNTTRRFVELVNQKFYNGLSFHKVVPGFVVQTGDPKSRLNKSDPEIGTGGSGQKLKAEINGRHHIRGTVAMAHANEIDTADSQFYITLNTFPHLDNSYTVFGQVIDFGEKVGGEDVLDRIRPNDEILEMTVE